MIKNGEDKYYIFPISNKYSRLFRKISSCFEFINKQIMTNMDKILAVAIAIKNPIISYEGNSLNPILLEDRTVSEKVIEATNKEHQNFSNNFVDYDQQRNYNYMESNNTNYGTASAYSTQSKI